jgi:hypothetical protein
MFGLTYIEVLNVQGIVFLDCATGMRPLNQNPYSVTSRVMSKWRRPQLANSVLSQASRGCVGEDVALMEWRSAGENVLGNAGNLSQHHDGNPAHSVFWLQWERGCAIVSQWDRPFRHQQNVITFSFHHPPDIRTPVGASNVQKTLANPVTVNQDRNMTNE